MKERVEEADSGYLFSLTQLESLAFIPFQGAFNHKDYMGRDRAEHH